MTGKIRIGRLAIAVLLVGGALTYLVYQGTRQNLTYYYDVDELSAAAADGVERIRISGDIVDGSIIRAEDAREVRFAIRSSSAGESGTVEQVEVVYGGTVPDIFQPGIQVVVEGSLDSEGTFHAETLLTKCPSKYQAEGELTTLEPAPRS